MVCCAGASAEECFDAAVKGSQRGIQEARLKDGRVFRAGWVPAVFPRLKNIAAAALAQMSGDIERARLRWGARRVGVCAGSCDNGSEESLRAHDAYFSLGAFPPDYRISAQSASGIAEWIASAYRLEGPCLTAATACASSAGAVVKGKELLEAGVCDAVLAGGADLLSPTVLSGFSALEALSPEITNPFSKNRQGITLGEGAAFFVLSREPPPGPRPLAALLGAGESADAFHMTAPRPDGSSAALAMRRAFAQAVIAHFVV
jgi:3-oxoacyl-[acyl-carrier-protein] synthase-1